MTMSYRASFTSEYIDCDSDYKIIREKANNLSSSKNICIAPPFFLNGEEMPIIQGRVGNLAEGCESLDLEEFLLGIKTEHPVVFVVIPDSIEQDRVLYRIVKETDGEVVVDDYIKTED